MLSLVRSLSRLPASILIVEDEALVRFLGVGMFANAGFRVIEAADSEGGTIDGLALAVQVHDRWPRIGIIVVSGNAIPQLHELPAGCRFYRKPYDADTVIRHARDLMAV